MTHNEAMDELRTIFRNCQYNDDIDKLRTMADKIIASFLRDNGYGEMADLYESIPKWYA